MLTCLYLHVCFICWWEADIACVVWWVLLQPVLCGLKLEIPVPDIKDHFWQVPSNHNPNERSLVSWVYVLDHLVVTPMKMKDTTCWGLIPLFSPSWNGCLNTTDGHCIRETGLGCCACCIHVCVYPFVALDYGCTCCHVWCIGYARDVRNACCGVVRTAQSVQSAGKGMWLLSSPSAPSTNWTVKSWCLSLLWLPSWLNACMTWSCYRCEFFACKCAVMCVCVYVCVCLC